MVRSRLALAWFVAALLAAAALVTLRARTTRPGHPVVLARPASTRSADPADHADPAPSATLRAVLDALDSARATAYADPLDGDPDAWDAPSCSCHAEDVRRLRDLAASGLALRDVAAVSGSPPPGPAARRAGAARRADAPRLVVLSLTVTRAGPATVEAVVVDRLLAYAAVDARGRIVRRWPATGPRRWRITFVRTSGRWLIGALARAP